MTYAGDIVKVYDIILPIFSNDKGAAVTRLPIGLLNAPARSESERSFLA